MAYRIIYDWEKERILGEKRKFPALTAVCVAVAVAAALFRLLYPQSDWILDGLLYPLGDEFTMSAFGGMVEQIGDGMPVTEAVAAFCREIIANGGNG